MKYILNRSVALFAVGVLAGLTCVAQDYSTRTSVGDQIRNNTAPGLKYAPVSAKTNTATVNESQPTEKERTPFKQQILQGKLGMPISKSQPASVSTPATSTSQLPSDISAAQRKTELEKSIQTVKIVPLPTQGDVVPVDKPNAVITPVKVPTQDENPPVEKKKE